jgi:ligand-binding SRPBCC domain-containing protein
MQSPGRWGLRYDWTVKTIRLETFLLAPPARCFDLSRSVDLHTASAESTGERAVAGTTSGLMGEGDEVTWEAQHFGLRHRMSVRIDGWARPAWFTDSQTTGPFRHFHHRHEFVAQGEGTLMRDTLTLSAPFGGIGRLAEPLLALHLRRFLAIRNDELRRVAEGEEWRSYLPGDSA